MVNIKIMMMKILTSPTLLVVFSSYSTVVFVSRRIVGHSFFKSRMYLFMNGMSFILKCLSKIILGPLRQREKE